MPFLEASTTIGCPMRCSYCPQDRIGVAYDGPRTMSVKTFEKALSNIPRDLPVCFAGYAEPFLHRQCGKLLRMAAEGGRRLELYTTGVGMTDMDVKLVAEMNPSRVVLHAPDAAGDMKANVSDEYADRMRRFMAALPRAMVDVKGTIHRKLIDLLPRVGAFHLHSRAGNVPQLIPIRHGGPLKCRTSPGLEENVMLPNGDLAVCCQDYGLRHIVGNIARETWAAIHDGPQMQEMRGLMRHGECLCRTCEFAMPAVHP